MGKHKKNLILSFSLILLGIAAVVVFYPKTHPLYGVKQNLQKDSLENLAVEVGEFIGIDTKGYIVTNRFKTKKGLLRQLQSKFGIENSNKIAREKLPVYYWQLNYYKNDDINLMSTTGDDEETKRKLQGDIEFSFDTRGNLLSFELGLSDSVELPTISEQKAQELSEAFVARFTGFSKITPRQISEVDTISKPQFEMSFSNEKGVETKVKRGAADKKLRTDYQFSFSKEDSLTGNTVEATVYITGNMVSKFEVIHHIPEKYETDDDIGINNLIDIVVYLVVIAVMLILLFKRMRAYEIGFKMAISLAVITAVSVAAEMLLQSSSKVFSVEMLIPLALGPLFVGLAVLVLWAVTESVTREVWQEKLVSLDLLGKGHIFHSRLGGNLLAGIGMGFGLLAVWLTLSYVFQQLTEINLIPLKGNENFISSLSPSLYLLTSNFYAFILEVMIFGVFILSYLRAKLNSKVLIVIIAAVIWGLAVSQSMSPWYFGNLLFAIIGVIVVLSLLKYEVFPVLVGVFSFEVLNSGVSFFYMDNPDFLFSGIVLSVLLILILGWTIVTFYTKDKEIDFDAIRPAFAKYISERQRLQRELEIARDVQMSFLPRSNPKVPGLDIAARCLPANEVGGDYYDFINMNHDRFGVVIGDVSGKGTQAAFYMTLTKGFLKALSKTLNDPVEILTRMNNLFYENVDRGTFISVLYGIFDLDDKNLELARGGHNPVIHITNKGELKKYNPKGMALGLEKGYGFSQNIDKSSVSFEPGDVFVFYTDGFPEAMNKAKEEFGEEKFNNIFKEVYKQSAQEILDNTYSKVLKYMMSSKQNDDMTLVIIKIKENEV